MSQVTSQPLHTDLQIARDAAFETMVYNERGDYRTSQQFVKGDLPYGVDLYTRVRHIGHPDTETEDSNWSNAVKFRVIIPANIIGVCLDNDPTKGVFYWIDAMGNRVSSFDWQSHPTYAGITMVTTDASRAPVTLTRFPKFFIKTAASGPVGTFANGKKCWWISDLEETGFRPHPCFKRSASTNAEGKYVIAPHCDMGTFLGHSEAVGGKTCIGSKRGMTVRVSQTKTAFKTQITNRNNAAAGESGYRMFDIWDLSALRMLLLIAKANSDMQSAWGDNSAGTAYPKTGSTNARAVFKGTHTSPTVSIDDLWRCYWYHVDLITVNAGVVTLYSPMNLTSALPFNSSNTSRYKQSTTFGWIRDVCDFPFTIGDDIHDLMELFIPNTVVSSENQGTFSDYNQPYFTDAYTIATNLPMLIGRAPGEADPRSTAGIFTPGVLNGCWVGFSSGAHGGVYPYPGCTSIFHGSRLSKNS